MKENNIVNTVIKIIHDCGWWLQERGPQQKRPILSTMRSLGELLCVGEEDLAFAALASLELPRVSRIVDNFHAV